MIDADLRDTDICRKATDLCSTGLPDLAEGTEMHVQFLDHFSGDDNRVEMEPAPLCLLVNHTHCVASYVSGLPSAKNVDLNLLPLDPNQCMYPLIFGPFPLEMVASRLRNPLYLNGGPGLSGSSMPLLFPLT